ncbi:N-acetylmuramoyl-L-alanine amidase [Blautia liquoris]|uniref:N-acetylmuramoyl-L-alanine amidase n=1 Tax=Blautia liquoris TaxID=2779518 RepID=A0A7M2RFA3_9FIRM|nr:N-acetylmuramoyl-L-alanine amidase [Blautia liquoris]QOV19025.1 N-acetylmuramoyl-L-alanine amidase [Blautia liquoris]
MKINKLLTKINLTSANNTGRIKYIVIHYVGATGGAKANCQYYASQYVGASAHYYAGFGGEIWQSVEDKDIAWHCGAKSYKHPECRNANSIGIELCVRNKGSMADTSRDWYFEDATVASAIQLTRELMAKYGVPADHVIRHYDVTGKICPNPYVYNHTKHTWQDFKAQISGQQSAPTPHPAEASAWKATGTATCGGNSVRVRREPNGAVVGSLNSGQRFEVDGQTSGSWTHVNIAGIGVGWMATQYVVPDKAQAVQPAQAAQSVPATNNPIVRDGQIHCNNFCNAGLKEDGIRGAATVRGGVMVLQQAANMDYAAGLKVDGIPGAKTDAALSGHTVRIGESQEMVRALQILLMLRGYDPNGVDGSFGGGCDAAVRRYQADHGLTVDGIADVNTFMSLIA